MDIVTLLLARKEITGALTGFSDVKLSADNTQIIFVAQDGTEFRIPVPTPINKPETLNKITEGANGELLFDGKEILVNDTNSVPDTSVDDMMDSLGWN